MKRTEKIQLLKDIESGSVKVEDLEPKHFKLELFADNDEWENTTHIVSINGKQVDHETYMMEAEKAWCPGSNATFTILYNGEDLEDWNKRHSEKTRPAWLEKIKNDDLKMCAPVKDKSH